MIKEAINRILELSPNVVRELLPGMQYSDRALHDVRPHTPILQTHISLCTLTGVIDWLCSGDAENARQGCVIHIEDYDHVRVFSTPDEYYRSRHAYIAAACPKNHFAFGDWHSIESFIIEASSKFVMTPELQNVIKTISNIKSEEVIHVEDDGISQAVTSSAKLRRFEIVQISPFVNLQPFRTFREIEQPESRFLMRMRQQKDALPKIALFEADNGEWKLEAMRRIKQFISDGLKNENYGINIVM